MAIHPTAVIESGAELGSNVSVGPFAYLQHHVVIGNNTIIGPHVTIFAHTTLGPDCAVHAGAVLGDVPQDLGFKNVPSRVVIGAHCTIREGVTIHRGTSPDSVTEIGDNCFLMAFSHFAHNVKLGNRVIAANGALCAGYVQIGDRVVLGGGCAIHQFVRIGEGAMIAGVCGVSKDVPPFCMTRASAYNVIVGLNIVGMRRAGMSAEERLEVKRIFAMLFRSGLNTSTAVMKIRASFTSPSAIRICDFVESSQRGICKFVPVRGIAEDNCTSELKENSSF